MTFSLTESDLRIIEPSSLRGMEPTERLLLWHCWLQTGCRHSVGIPLIGRFENLGYTDQRFRLAKFASLEAAGMITVRHDTRYPSRSFLRVTPKVWGGGQIPQHDWLAAYWQQTDLSPLRVWGMHQSRMHVIAKILFGHLYFLCHAHGESVCLQWTEAGEYLGLHMSNARRACLRLREEGLVRFDDEWLGGACVRIEGEPRFGWQLKRHLVAVGPTVQVS